MADEVPLANVVRLEYHAEGGLWSASVGPREGGLRATGRDRAEAIMGLLAVCDWVHWPWDETWTDRLV